MQVSSNATQNLSRLFRDAAGATDAEGKGLGNKGLQIMDALTDASKKISLKPGEVDRLLSHVGKLPAADKAAAIETLDLFRDRFDVADDGARKKLLDFVPKTAAPVEVGGAVRTVSAAQADSLKPTPQAKASDIKETDKLINDVKETAGPGGEALAAELRHAKDQAFEENIVKPAPDARKAYVESIAKQPSKDPVEGLFDKYARSPFFEDRLMAAMGRNSLKFMKEMNERMEAVNDPKHEEEIRDAFKASMTKMLGMAERLSPEGKVNAAGKLAEFLQANPNVVGGPELEKFMEQARALPPAGAPNHDEALKALPVSDNTVIEALGKSQSPEVRQWAAVFKAAKGADQMKFLMAQNPTSDEDMRATHAKAKEWAATLNENKGMLPPDLQAKIGDVQLDALPAAIDPTSRQMRFQQVNMMMNQYQQIMQAMSETINKMNEMAMEPIRKMGR